MAIQDKLVTESHEGVTQFLETVSDLATQAREVRGVYDALGGAAVLEGYVWPEGFTEQDFVEAMDALGAILTYIATSGYQAKLYKLRLAF
ncbi:MAG: hypothetical protein R3C43_19230 [Chloroflexota bacterium]